MLVHTSELSVKPNPLRPNVMLEAFVKIGAVEVVLLTDELELLPRTNRTRAKRGDQGKCHADWADRALSCADAAVTNSGRLGRSKRDYAMA
jgi:hypothetical protein